LHFGSFVTAVASYAEARSHGGVWLVRIEDLDPSRVVAGAADDILRTLEACGLHWDGSVVYQNQRFDAYHAALHFLRKLKVIYPCACSRREIADSALAEIEGQVYPGTCRGGLASDKHVRAWRINTHGVRITFKDVLQGKIEQDLEHEIGDFVLYRFDRVFAYQLAVVIDDAEQGITDVVRGADLLDSTSRQIYLQRLLGLPALRYMHVPVAVDHHGKKLSKQTLVAAINTKNPLPILLAALHFLGHEPPPEIATADIATLWQWTIKHWHCRRVPREKWLSV
jgi:glutamyl-Q tRNA(Asp) synthetase